MSGITLTPEESRQFGQLFTQHDVEGIGILLGDSIRPLFERSGLSPKILGQIWQLADNENRGFLDSTGFAKALRMIAHVQNGQPLSAKLFTIPSSLPDFDRPAASTMSGTAPAPRVVSQSSTAASSIPQPVGVADTGARARAPPLTTADKQRFGQLFDKTAQGRPMIDGPTAREVFMKARLPTEYLGKIWSLVDPDNRGSLTKNEFVLAMHIIQCSINGSLPTIPETLPPAWEPWLEGSRIHRSGPLNQNSTGQAKPPPATPAPRQWQIGTRELQQYNAFFDQLDVRKAGILGAAEAVPFMTKSRLPEDVLAKVWDLADTQSRGQLDRRDFAIAMYLIQAKLNGVELLDTLPASLWESTSALVESHSTGQKRFSSQYTGQLTSQSTGQRNPSLVGHATGLAQVPTQLPGQLSRQRVSSTASSASNVSGQPLAGITPLQPPTRQVSQGVSVGSTNLSSNQPVSSNSQPQDRKGSLSDLVELQDAFKPLEPTRVQHTESSIASHATGQASQSQGSSFAAVSENKDKRFVPTSSFGQKLLSQNFSGAASSGGNMMSTTSASPAPNTGVISAMRNQVNELTSKVADAAAEAQRADAQLTSVKEQSTLLERQIATLRKEYDNQTAHVHQTQQLVRQAREEMKQLEKDQALREGGLKAIKTQHEKDTLILEDLKKQRAEQTEKLADMKREHEDSQAVYNKLKQEIDQMRAQIDASTHQIAMLENTHQQALEAVKAARIVHEDLTQRVQQSQLRIEELNREIVLAQSNAQQQIEAQKKVLSEAEEQQQLVTASIARKDKALKLIETERAALRQKLMTVQSDTAQLQQLHQQREQTLLQLQAQMQAEQRQYEVQKVEREEFKKRAESLLLQQKQIKAQQEALQKQAEQLRLSSTSPMSSRRDVTGRDLPGHISPPHQVDNSQNVPQYTELASPDPSDSPSLTPGVERLSSENSHVLSNENTNVFKNSDLLNRNGDCELSLTHLDAVCKSENKGPSSDPEFAEFVDVTEGGYQRTSVLNEEKTSESKYSEKDLAGAQETNRPEDASIHRLSKEAANPASQNQEMRFSDASFSPEASQPTCKYANDMSDSACLVQDLDCAKPSCDINDVSESATTYLRDTVDDQDKTHGLYEQEGSDAKTEFPSGSQESSNQNHSLQDDSRVTVTNPSSMKSRPNAPTASCAPHMKIPVTPDDTDFGDEFNNLVDATTEELSEEDDYAGFGNGPLQGNTSEQAGISSAVAIAATGYGAPQSHPQPPAFVPSVTPNISQQRLEPQSSNTTGPDEWQQLFSGSGVTDYDVASNNDTTLNELLAMGFDEHDAAHALEKTGGNVTEATNLLLGGN